MEKKKLVVIKVGTKNLVNKDYRVSRAILYELVRQITMLYEQNIMTVLVSSGAGIAGKEVLHEVAIKENGIRQQVYCAVGQPRLMRLYYDIFHHYGMHCAQVLATKGDFEHITNRKNLMTCYEGLLQEGIIPITNENDATSLKTMFSDNDELAAWVAELLHADQLIYLAKKQVNDLTDRKILTEKEYITIKTNSETNHIPSSLENEPDIKPKITIAKIAAKKGIPSIIAAGEINNIFYNIFYKN